MFWSCFSEEAKAFSGTDDEYAQMLEEQEAKALQDTAQGAGLCQPGKRKDKYMPWICRSSGASLC